MRDGSLVSVIYSKSEFVQAIRRCSTDVSTASCGAHIALKLQLPRDSSVAVLQI